MPPGLAVRDTVLPLSVKAEQALPQLILGVGALTVPMPVLATISASGARLIAEFCAAMKSPSSSAAGAAQTVSAQIALWVMAS